MWGIKLKNEDLSKFKLRITIMVVIRVLLFTGLGIFLLYFLMDYVLNDFLANTLHNFSTSLYYFLVRRKVFLVIGLIGVIVIFSIYYAISKVTQYITIIIKSIQDISTQEDKLITNMPADLKYVEDKLNEIKYTSLKNERIAKEAEQRKNDLIVYMAHDLKTPLTSVIGYLTLLQEEENIPEEMKKKYLTISLEKAERLEDLINEFFEITRFNMSSIVLEKTKVNISRMLNQLTDEFYPLLKEKELRYTFNIDNDIVIFADSNKLARVFDNLLKNAINYSYPNTDIEIQATERVQDIVISVRNMGQKIPEHKLNNIFEKFYRLDAARSSNTGGAGLGLAIAKEIVELHEGSIYAKSNEEYTEFVVTLPKEKREENKV